MLILVAALAHAEPAADPTAILAGRLAREGRADVFLGASDRSPLATACRLSLESGANPAGPQELTPLLEPELAACAGAASWADPVGTVRPRGRLALGDRAPDYRGGDVEDGLASVRAEAEARAYAGAFEAAVRPELGLDALGTPTVREGASPSRALPLQPTPGFALREAWAGARTDALAVGAGLRDRWIGPGRHSGLMLTDDARPAPFAGLAAESRPWAKAGRFRGEAGGGWLDGEREDVRNPGWLLMDARWLPVPEIEIGATRMAIFGGEGRPSPRLVDLLIPSEPHVEGDPTREVPDQDEIAALDVRATLPLGAWPLRGAFSHVRYVEVWWQYAGEDVIERDLAGIPYPALAGVANLVGVEAAVGPAIVTFEGARALDDTFRWYTGHRVYHEGFTRDGRSMGLAPGGDSVLSWGAFTWFPGEWGAQAWAERVRRVGVVESEGENLFALATDEVSTRGGLRGWRRSGRGWWTLDLSVERIDGADFVPGADQTTWRVAVGR